MGLLDKFLLIIENWFSGVMCLKFCFVLFFVKGEKGKHIALSFMFDIGFRSVKEFMLDGMSVVLSKAKRKF